MKARTLVTGAVLAAACALPAPASAGTPELLGSLLTEVNAARVDAGVWPLQADTHLSIAASRYAARMSAEGFFAHDAPDGTGVLDRVRAVRWPGLRRRGWELHELLGRASGILDSPKAMVTAWLQSPPHRAGMLDPDVTRAGLGAVAGHWVLITADPGEPRKRRRARAARKRG